MGLSIPERYRIRYRFIPAAFLCAILVGIALGLFVPQPWRSILAVVFGAGVSAVALYCGERVKPFNSDVTHSRHSR